MHTIDFVAKSAKPPLIDTHVPLKMNYKQSYHKKNENKIFSICSKIYHS